MWDPVGDYLNEAAENAWTDLAVKLYDGAVMGLQWLSTWWLNVPAPKLALEGGDSPAELVQLYTRALIGVVGLISTVIVIVKYAARQGQGAEQLGWAIARTVIFSGLTLSVVGLLLTFGDLSAPWFVKMIGGVENFDKGMDTLSSSQEVIIKLINGNQAVVMLLIFVFVVALIGSILNLFFMLFAYGMLPVVAGMIPVLAAGSVTERGAAAFYKVVGWTLATCLFKPIAGIVFGGGIAMVKLLTSTDGAKLGTDQVAMQVLCGFMVIGAAGVVLPALIRLVVPTMAAASRGVGGTALVMAGGAALTGAVTGGTSLMAKLGSSQAQTIARGGRAGLAAAGGGNGGSLGGPAPAPVNRGLVNPERHGYPSQARTQNPQAGPPKAPPIPPREQAAAKNGGRTPAPAAQAPAGPAPQRPAAPRPSGGSGRRRMDSARNHLSQQIYKAEDGIEGGEA